MTQIKHIKNFVFSFIVIWLLTPATAFAVNPYYVHKSDSVGEIFRDIIFRHIFGLYIILGTTLILLIPAIILGYFVHRKYIGYLFFLVYPFVFLIPILTGSGEKLSNILLHNIFNFYIAVLFIVIAFFASTLLNKIKKKKRNFSKNDYIPLAIIIAVTLVLMLLPIRSGHLVCKTPGLNKHFSCNYYLQEDERLNRSWFVF